MLSNEALHERKWGRYPTLDRLLGHHSVPSHLYGPTSVSDNVFDRLTRLLEVAFTIKEHMESIRTVTDAEICRLLDDLEHLEHELRVASRFLAEHADSIGRLHHDALEQAPVFGTILRQTIQNQNDRSA